MLHKLDSMVKQVGKKWSVFIPMGPFRDFKMLVSPLKIGSLSSQKSILEDCGSMISSWGNTGSP